MYLVGGLRRKVIRQGHNTLTVTLPAKWVKKRGVAAGDEVVIEEREDGLLLSVEKNAMSLLKEIDITGFTPPVLWRFVSSAYRAGYNEMLIKFGSASEDKELYTAFSYDTMNYLLKGDLPKGKIPIMSPIETIQALVNRFIGVEIIDQKENYCVVKQLGEITYKEFDNALRRIFLIILSMADECTKSTKGSREGLKAIHMIDTNLDRFEDYCLRVLNVRGYADYRKTSTIYTIIFLLELLGDEYKKLGLHLLKSKDGAKKTIPLMEEVNAQLQRFYELYYKFSKEKVIEIFEKESNVLCKMVEELNGLSEYELELVHHLKKISRFIISLTELRVDLEE
jgi:phosphate uptake regulator